MSCVSSSFGLRQMSSDARAVARVCDPPAAFVVIARGRLTIRFGLPIDPPAGQRSDGDGAAPRGCAIRPRSIAATRMSPDAAFALRASARRIGTLRCDSAAASQCGRSAATRATDGPILGRAPPAALRSPGMGDARHQRLRIDTAACVRSRLEPTGAARVRGCIGRPGRAVAHRACALSARWMIVQHMCSATTDPASCVRATVRANGFAARARGRASRRQRFHARPRAGGAPRRRARKRLAARAAVIFMSLSSVRDARFPGFPSTPASSLHPDRTTTTSREWRNRVAMPRPSRRPRPVAGCGSSCA